jgi:putative phosphoribosyl transferase
MGSMYFDNRTQAGTMLADLLVKDLAGKPCAVVALSEGGVVIGAQIALRLRAVLTMLLVEPIDLPNEPDPIGSISETGDFSYNSLYSAGQIEELMGDYRVVVEDEKRTGLVRMHQLLGAGTGIRRDLLHNKHVILVSDGFSTGFSIDIALEVFKPILFKELIIATPIASVEAVDRMHIKGDRIYCLSVADLFLDTEHYYDHHDVPSRADVVKIVQEVQDQWRE